jgi:hypothetical protein
LTKKEWGEERHHMHRAYTDDVAPNDVVPVNEVLR